MLECTTNVLKSIGVSLFFFVEAVHIKFSNITHSKKIKMIVILIHRTVALLLEKRGRNATGVKQVKRVRSRPFHFLS